MAKVEKKKLSRTCNKIRTPLNLLNTFLGGGISFGTAVQFFGATKSGKSTAALQTAQYFLENYPNGRVVIIDSEGNYSSGARLEKVFDLHPHNSVLETVEQDERVFFFRMATIEKVFMTLIKFAKESTEDNIPTFIIVDSISALSASSVVEEINKSADKGKDVNVYAGGQSANAAIMTKLLGPLVDEISNSWTSVVFINQVTVSRTIYGNPEVAKGGYALGHMLHLSVKFNIKSLSNQGVSCKDTSTSTERFGSLEDSDDDTIKPITISSVVIDKNKCGISDNGGSAIMIDNLIGGRIVENYEICETLAKTRGILVSRSSVIGLNEDLQAKYRDVKTSNGKGISDNWNYKELIKTPEMISVLKKEILLHYFKNVKSIRDEYEQISQISRAKEIPIWFDFDELLKESQLNGG
jgi:RecA/RadA recombinase